MERVDRLHEFLAPRGDVLLRLNLRFHHGGGENRISVNLLLDPRPARLHNVKLVEDVIPRVEHPIQTALFASLHGEQRAPDGVHGDPLQLGRTLTEHGGAALQQHVGVEIGFNYRPRSPILGDGRSRLGLPRGFQRASQRICGEPRAILVLKRHDVPQVGALHPPSGGEVPGEHPLKLRHQKLEGDTRGHDPGQLRGVVNSGPHLHVAHHVFNIQKGVHHGGAHGAIEGEIYPLGATRCLPHGEVALERLEGERDDEAHVVHAARADKLRTVTLYHG